MAAVPKILGVDPGRKAGSGLALIDAERRRIWRASHGIWSTGEIIEQMTGLAGAEWQGYGLVVAVEIMTAMGAAKFSADQARNTQFVGEIIGHCRERGMRVIEVTKREALSSIGCKGKSSGTRVRRSVRGLFGSSADGVGMHEIDAVAAAWAAWLKMRNVRLTQRKAR